MYIYKIAFINLSLSNFCISKNGFCQEHKINWLSIMSYFGDSGTNNIRSTYQCIVSKVALVNHDGAKGAIKN